MQSHTKATCLGLMVCAAALGCCGCMDTVRAEAGIDRTVEPGETVTLDAGDSVPSRRYALAYSWTVVEGGQVTLSGAQARVTTFVAPRLPTETTLIIELTATYVDLGGNLVDTNSDTDRVVIRVHADPDAAVATDTQSEDGAAQSNEQAAS